MSAHIIAVASQKGGVAKTTSSINVSVALAELNRKLKIAVVDLDPQGHVAASFSYNKSAFKKTIYDVLIGDVKMRKIGVRTKYGIDIFPSNTELANLDVDITNNPEVFPNPLHVLHKALDDIRDMYDIIFIDCPPSLTLATKNALTASNEVIIPIKCEHLSVDGLVDLLKTINDVQKEANPNLKIKGVVATMMSSRGHLNGVVLQETKVYCEKLGIHVFLNTVRNSVRIASAVGEGIPAIHFDRRNDAVQDYIRLTKEVFKLE